MAKKNETPITQDEDILDLLQGGEEKRTPAEEVIEDGVSAEIAEAVEVENEPVAEAPKKRTTKKTREPEQEEPKAALTATSRSTSTERKLQVEAHQAVVKARQSDAVIAGGYLNAQRRNNVVSGKIAGVESRGNHAFWIIYDGPVTVMIPFSEALPALMKPELLEDTEDALKVQSQLLSKSIGLEVPFTVEQIETDQKDYFVFGSRRKAMERISKRYFGANAEKPIKMGDFTEATVLAVGEHAAWVTVNGMDVRMVAAQMSYRYMENLMEYFEPGDKLIVQVQPDPKRQSGKKRIGDDVDMDKDGNPIMLLSALPQELQECSSRLSRIRKGNRYHAVISTLRIHNVRNEKTKKVEKVFVASCWLEGVEVAAFANVVPHFQDEEDKKVFSGAKVLTEVQSITNNGYVRVKIVKHLA